MAKIRRRTYKSKSKQIRVAMDRVYSLLGHIKHAYGLSDDDTHYYKMKQDLVKIAEEADDISSKAQQLLRSTPLKHY